MSVSPTTSLQQVQCRITASVGYRIRTNWSSTALRSPRRSQSAMASQRTAGEGALGPGKWVGKGRQHGVHPVHIVCPLLEKGTERFLIAGGVEQGFVQDSAAGEQPRGIDVPHGVDHRIGGAKNIELSLIGRIHGNSSREGSVPGAAREVNWILGHKGPYWAILRDDGGFRQRNHAAGTGQREGVMVKRQLYVYIWIP